MRDVNELKKTGPTKFEDLNTIPQTQSTISLSTLTNESAQSNAVNINTINGLTGVPDVPPQPTPVVNISPRRTHRHRSTTDTSVQQVNPDDYIEKPAPPKVETPTDRAIDLLAQDVERRRQEFKDFVEYANEADKVNRELVDAGLETVGEEIQYMPDQLHEPISEEEKITPALGDINEDIVEEIHSVSDMIEDDFQYEDADEGNVVSFESNPSSISVKNPFEFKELPEAKEEDPPEEKVSEPIEENIVTEEPSTETEGVKEESAVDKIISNSINMTSSALDTPISSASTDDFDINEEDLEDISSEEPVEEETSVSDEEMAKLMEASNKNLRSEVLQKMIHVGKAMNTSQFIISNKVINLKDAIKNIPSFTKKVERTAVWPLMFAGRPFKASALKGPEIAMLADTDNSDSQNSIGLTLEQAKILFEHDANPYRPNSLESWAKTIPFNDIDNIFAAIFAASLKGANYIPMSCPKNNCLHAFLSEDLPIDSLVKFKDDTVKEKFNNIKKMELTLENSSSYESVISAINDKFAVGLKLPSIFTMLYEFNSILGTEFFRKYRTMISMVQYIDYIYYIDEETSQFQPIGWKTYPGDYSKSFKSKIATYAKILKELDETEFAILLALMSSMVTKMAEARSITFEIPEGKCPKCHSVIPSRSMIARVLIFVRQRLVELATTHSES